MIRVNLLKAEKKTIEDQTFAPEGEAAEKKGQGRAKKKAPPGNLLIVLALIVLGALAFTQKKALDAERNLLTAAQDQQRLLQPVIDKLDQLEWQREFLGRKVVLVSELRSQQGTAVRLLDTMSSALPDWVWLTEAVFNKNGLQIRGRALTNVLISDYVRNLNESGVFDNAGIVSTQQRSEANNQFVEFTISATLPAPPPAAPLKKAEAK